MAILKDPGNLYWRSKHGAVVGQKNRPIAGARRLVRPSQFRSQRQQKFRYQLNDVISLWHSLSESEKGDWQDFADTFSITDKYGNPAFLSGWNWFVKLNKRLKSVETSLLVSPPVDDIPSFDPTLSVTFPNGDNSVSFVVSPSLTGENKIYVHRKINLNTGQSWPPRPLDSYNFFDSSSSSPYYVALSSEVKTTPVLHWFQFSPIDADGLRPADTFLSITVDN